ncbi:MAG: MBL fold metallo-hydrolase [Anaerolineae bacterium]|nr:MBL fold metallo-hydrolase [Anaerolineae bacterium]MDQ7035836.1 MBL fold metallo-hydrolase [Anaerolineae bacterium]
MPMFRELEALAPRVYMFPRDETPNTIQPNIGVLRLKNQTILIDAGNSPRHARQIMAAMAGEDFASIETIIYTHHHWDHTFGAATFNASTIVAQSQNSNIMANYATRPWGVQYLREELYRDPQREVSLHAMMDAIPDWREFRICQPTITFNKILTLYYDGLTLELEAVGGRHASDSLIVRIPEAGVMFVGDSYYPPPSHLHEEDDIDLALPMMESFLSDDYHIYVDGHGAPRSRSEFEQVIAYEKKRQGLLEL